MAIIYATVDESNLKYSLIYNKQIKGYVLKYPNMQRFLRYVKTSDVYDIYVDEEKNIYFCRQFDFCCFCGKQSKEYIFGKPVCRSCLKRLKNAEFDENEVTSNAEEND